MTALYKWTSIKLWCKILQGSVVTQTVVGGLTIHPPAGNILQCIGAKNYDSWFTADTRHCDSDNNQAFFVLAILYISDI